MEDWQDRADRRCLQPATSLVSDMWWPDLQREQFYSDCDSPDNDPSLRSLDKMHDSHGVGLEENYLVIEPQVPDCPLTQPDTPGHLVIEPQTLDHLVIEPEALDCLVIEPKVLTEPDTPYHLVIGSEAPECLVTKPETPHCRVAETETPHCLVIEPEVPTETCESLMSMPAYTVDTGTDKSYNASASSSTDNSMGSDSPPLDLETLVFNGHWDVVETFTSIQREFGQVYFVNELKRMYMERVMHLEDERYTQLSKTSMDVVKYYINRKYDEERMKIINGIADELAKHRNRLAASRWQYEHSMPNRVRNPQGNQPFHSFGQSMLNSNTTRYGNSIGMPQGPNPRLGTSMGMPQGPRYGNSMGMSHSPRCGNMMGMPQGPRYGNSIGILQGPTLRHGNTMGMPQCPNLRHGNSLGMPQSTNHPQGPIPSHGNSMGTPPHDPNPRYDNSMGTPHCPSARYDNRMGMPHGPNPRYDNRMGMPHCPNPTYDNSVGMQHCTFWPSPAPVMSTVTRGFLKGSRPVPMISISARDLQQRLTQAEIVPMVTRDLQREPTPVPTMPLITKDLQRGPTIPLVTKDLQRGPTMPLVTKDLQREPLLPLYSLTSGIPSDSAQISVMSDGKTKPLSELIRNLLKSPSITQMKLAVLPEMSGGSRPPARVVLPEMSGGSRTPTSLALDGIAGMHVLKLQSANIHSSRYRPSLPPIEQATQSDNNKRQDYSEQPEQLQTPNLQTCPFLDTCQNYDYKKDKCRWHNGGRNILRRWFLDNLDYPYIKNANAEELAEKCGLTSAQVKTWIVRSRDKFGQIYMVLSQTICSPDCVNILLNRIRHIMSKNKVTEEQARHWIYVAETIIRKKTNGNDSEQGICHSCSRIKDQHMCNQSSTESVITPTQRYQLPTVEHASIATKPNNQSSTYNVSTATQMENHPSKQHVSTATQCDSQEPIPIPCIGNSGSVSMTNGPNHCNRDTKAIISDDVLALRQWYNPADCQKDGPSHSDNQQCHANNQVEPGLHYSQVVRVKEEESDYLQFSNKERVNIFTQFLSAELIAGIKDEYPKIKIKHSKVCPLSCNNVMAAYKVVKSEETLPEIGSDRSIIDKYVHKEIACGTGSEHNEGNFPDNNLKEVNKPFLDIVLHNSENNSTSMRRKMVLQKCKKRRRGRKQLIGPAVKRRKSLINKNSAHKTVCETRVGGSGNIPKTDIDVGINEKNSKCKVANKLLVNTCDHALVDKCETTVVDSGLEQNKAYIEGDRLPLESLSHRNGNDMNSLKRGLQKGKKRKEKTCQGGKCDKRLKT